MKKHIILAGLMIAAIGCLAVASTVIAQQNQPRTPESLVEMVDKAVKLTAEQKTKILEIYTDANSKDQQSGGKTRVLFSRETKAAVEKILTPDQVKKLLAYQLQLMVDATIAFIDKSVTLTGDQKEKITPIITKELKTFQDFVEEVLASGEKLDRQAMIDKFKDKRMELRTVTNKALESILTKEQLEKYKTIESIIQ